MADQSEVIKNNPIGSGLDTFLTSFSSLCKSKDTCCSEEALDHLGNKDVQELVFILLVTLQNLPAARLLPSRTRGTLWGDLLRLGLSLDSGDIDFGRFKPLLRVIIAKEPDEKIWAQVYHVVTESTPPRPIISHLKQTPLYRNMGSPVNSSELRIDTDDVLREDLGPMYVDVPGFYDAFFGRIPGLESASIAIFEKCRMGPNPLFREGWTGWPKDVNEASVLSWLETIIKQLMQWAQNDRQTPERGLWTKSNKSLDGSTAKRKMDVAILSYSAVLTDWSQILIPGELRSNAEEDRHTGAWFDIGKYVREVFFTQDTRRFVLAFTLCESLMRVWEFDRLGGIASAQFDINKDGLQFVSTILGFLWMDEKSLGFDPTFVPLNGGRYIDIVRNGTPERIVIDEVMTRMPCIAGRASTCWKAHPEEDPSTTLVIKDSWQYPERDVEGELLREVTEKGVCNVARYYHHETVYVNNNVDDVKHGIRNGLDITKASNYSAQSLNTPRISQNSQDNTASQKRSSSQTGAYLPLSKRPRLESSVKVDLLHPSPLSNRIRRRVIVRDYGRNISEASSRVALLAALEGCIEGHKSLHEAGILHRDISINNLLINEDNNNLSWPGFLIDLDLAIKEQREGASGPKGMTGTRAFMAIGVLRGRQHSFEHDLESFFWVLFWICIHYNGPKEKRVVCEFDEWNVIGTSELATLKRGTIADETDFIDILTQNFTPYYESLVPWVNRLRRVLFDKQGADSALYSRMQEVLREAQKDERVSSNAASG
ncbi:hypothetical protein Daesc_003542 [Daldinia eschscholtzii]|uniref:non-specific serine/threonine protein kinase n=1 Tax=Daldinia eschscholtzii TaxID=292717 RepID=A0AAX6MTQ1_9PEZI